MSWELVGCQFKYLVGGTTDLDITDVGENRGIIIKLQLDLVLALFLWDNTDILTDSSRYIGYFYLFVRI